MRRRDEQGATAVEYGMLLAGILGALLLVITMQHLGTGISNSNAFSPCDRPEALSAASC